MLSHPSPVSRVVLSILKSLLAMLFSSELQLSRRLLINTLDIVLAVECDAEFKGDHVYDRNRIYILEKYAGES